MHNTLFQIIYVVLEVVDVVLEVYHAQHTFSNNICCVGSSRCCVGGLPYTTHFFKYIMLCVIQSLLERPSYYSL